ncbi:hypothetical protein ABFG93_10375 [Pseudalkalibacillus hwajinpoensis]|uniref:hypothetical protein n=1 Tax=Guptibacillus hwajinpoensis TaxID=208199 RepID=UPI00325A4D19
MPFEQGNKVLKSENEPHVTNHTSERVNVPRLPIASDEGFSNVVRDSNQNYWFTKQLSSNHVEVYVFVNTLAQLRTFQVNGKPSFYEYTDSICIACEGEEWNGWIYEFSKENPRITHQWHVNGIFCDLKRKGKQLIVSSYHVEGDEALLTTFGNDGKVVIPLEKGYSPVNMMVTNEGIYVAALSITPSQQDQILLLDDEFQVKNSFKLDFSPRTIHSWNGSLIVHGINGRTGKSDQLVYISSETGLQEKFPIPSSELLECTDQYLTFYNAEAGILSIWSHEEKEMVSMRESERPYVPNLF